MKPGERTDAIATARKALDLYRGPRSDREAVVDLVADLMHHCDAMGWDAAEIIMAASRHHDAEQAIVADIGAAS